MCVNNSWCTNSVVVESHGSPDIESLTVKCRPIDLPREFTVVLVTAVSLPPDANTKSAIGLLHASISRTQNISLDAVQVIAGDFNHADLKAALPRFHQDLGRFWTPGPGTVYCATSRTA